MWVTLEYWEVSEQRQTLTFLGPIEMEHSAKMG